MNIIMGSFLISIGLSVLFIAMMGMIIYCSIVASGLIKVFDVQCYITKAADVLYGCMWIGEGIFFAGALLKNSVMDWFYFGCTLVIMCMMIIPIQIIKNEVDLI